MAPIALSSSRRWGNFCWTWSLVSHLPWWRSWPALTTRYSWIFYWRVCLICVSMIQLVVACSIQSGFKSVGVSCSAMSDVSSNGGKYGRRQSTLNTGCRPRNGGMMSSNELSPIALVMVYEPYRSGLSFRQAPVRCSFCKCNQTLSPTWNLCGTRCWSCRYLYLAFDFPRMSWTCWKICWMCSMKLVALSVSDWTWAEFVWVAASGMATSMGQSGWNPKPT